jgi:hypothetical protein
VHDEFEYCLRCGQPLRSWLSRSEGFGLQCSEALTPKERRRLVEMARATTADLHELEQRPTLASRLAELARTLSLPVRLRPRERD